MWQLRFGQSLKERTMRLTPNLSFGGQCEAAFKFYERCFGGKIVFTLSYGKSPMAEQVPPRWREKILHATLTVGDNLLMGADPVPEQYEQPKGFVVLLGIDEPVDAERIFHALAENGTVQMPLQKTFWSVCFGVLVDQFGIPWVINCEHAPSVA
jgi:PhnB protein